MEMKTQTKDISSKNIIILEIALLIFATPYYNLIDVFPDFIGCFFLIYGLRRLIFVSDSFHECEKNTMYYFVVSVFRLIVAIFANIYGDKILILSFLLIFEILEVYFLLKIFKEFFKGLDYLNIRYDDGKNPSLYSINGFTQFFIILRAILTFLPYLYSLNSNDSYSQDMAILFLNIISIIIILAFSIIWSIKLIEYLHQVKINQSFLQKIKEIYHDKIDKDPKVLLGYKMKIVKLLLLLSVVFQIKILIDDFDILLGCLSALFCFIGIILLQSKPNNKRNIFLLISCISLFLFSLSGSILRFVYYKRGFVPSNFCYIDKVRPLYLTIIILSVLESVMYFIIFSYSMISYHKINKTNIKDRYCQESQSVFKIGVMKRENFVFYIASVVNVIFMIFNSLFYIFSAYSFVFPSFNFIALLIGIVFSVIVYIYCNYMYDKVYSFYYYW